MDAVCDYCGNILSERDYMTGCGHIICGNVCYKESMTKCPICKKTCRFILIGEKMPHNATGFLKPAKNLFRDAENVINFRLLALTRLVRFLRDKITEQKEILNQAKQELSLVKQYKWEIYNLKRENEFLKNELQQARSYQNRSVVSRSRISVDNNCGSS